MRSCAINHSSHPVWQQLSKHTVYQGRVEIEKHEAKLPSGENVSYEVEHSDQRAVAALLNTPDGNVVLTYQYRYPLNRWIFDLPGGATEAGESLEDAVIRECREEVGIMPQRLEKLATFYPNPGRTDWSATVFYCQNFISSKLISVDPAESVEQVIMPYARLQELIDRQEIVDPALLIGWHIARSRGYIKF